LKFFCHGSAASFPTRAHRDVITTKSISFDLSRIT
jgi:hypothetical protein